MTVLDGAKRRGQLVAVARYPVKSLVGEDLVAAVVEDRGLVGDRQWAVMEGTGKLGSGKNTRRFRRLPGLLDLAADYEPNGVPAVTFPDGRRLRADHPDVDAVLSHHLGQPVTLGREAEVSHLDEGPLHLVSTSSLARLSEVHGARVDLRRLRPNLVVHTERRGFDEEDWQGREVSIGATVALRVREPMVRCAMVNLAQVGLAADPRLLSTIAKANDTLLGLVVDVVRGGPVRVGDAVRIG